MLISASARCTSNAANMSAPFLSTGLQCSTQQEAVVRGRRLDMHWRALVPHQKLILNELLSTSHSQYVSPVHLGMICAGLEDNEAALKWLEKVYDGGDATLSGVMIDPQFQSLRTNPRFRKLLQRMGLAGA